LTDWDSLFSLSVNSVGLPTENCGLNGTAASPIAESETQTAREIVTELAQK
jgi:hypothetical protein